MQITQLLLAAMLRQPESILAKEVEMEIKRIGVVGCGFMGSGIVQVSAQARYEVVVTDSDIREAFSLSIKGLCEGVKDMLETTPPEILSDIMHRGITLSGGGALLPGLGELLQRVLKIPVYVVEDPLSSVARGTGVILDNLPLYQEVLIGNQDELPPR